MDDCAMMAHAAPSGCDWCGVELSGRRRRWCSDKCHRTYVSNHKYSRARAAAKRKAWVRKGHWRCARCGDACSRVEVNHIEPCRGNHGQFGCWHHQVNLEVLCVPCHRTTTNQQRDRRLQK